MESGAWVEWPELLIGGTGAGLAEEYETRRPALPIDDGERRLAAMVFKHEFRPGGDTAPRFADGPTAVDVLGRQQDEYAVNQLLGKVPELGVASPVRHGAPLD